MEYALPLKQPLLLAELKYLVCSLQMIEIMVLVFALLLTAYTETMGSLFTNIVNCKIVSTICPHI